MCAPASECAADFAARKTPVVFVCRNTGVELEYAPYRL